jgi:hydrogenase-4 component F
MLLAICLAPASLAVVTYPVARAARQLGPVLNLLGAAAATALAIPIAASALRGEVLVGASRQLRADGLSALLVLVVAVVSLAAAIYAFPYMRLGPLLDRVKQNGADATQRRLAIFYALSQAFLATMLWACLTNNIVFLYVAVEASTIASGLLVTFYWDRRSLEAGYKYLMLLTVGIAFALFGCVFLYAAAAPHVPEGAGMQAMLISDLPDVVGKIPHGIALVILAFFIVGFGTKAGLAPFHPWLPDAHAEAPSPVSALLSGVMIKMAIYALARTLSIFLPLAAFHPVAVFVIVLAAFTMLLGGVMCLAQDDLKRMLAYSSVSQIGYIAMGVGLIAVGFGQTVSYLGGYGALFHLLNHALAKAGLFLAVGAVIYTTSGRRMSEVRGLARRMPITAVTFFVAAFAISGMPPFNGFWSKLTLYLAAAKAELWWALGIAILTSLLTLVAFVRTGYRVFWSDGGAPEQKAELREAPVAMLVPMGALSGLCLLIGLWPQSVYPLLHSAAQTLARLF